MRNKALKWTGGAVAVAAIVLAYLLATGERGLSSRERPQRSLDVVRLDAAATERLGWRSAGLDAVLDFAATLSADSLIIMTDGEIVASFGDLTLPLATHSIRKALLGAVVGQHVGDGARQIPLDATLGELGIDDAPQPLTALQKNATVRHLLKSVSGINHSAAAEAGLTAEKDRLLGADENEPGTTWAYNNWDYNALTTIFEARTGQTVGEAFLSGIAEPLGMSDFSPADVTYLDAPERSRHRAVAFRLSARDLARFGTLYLARGTLGGKEIIPASWIARITDDYTVTGRSDLRWGHGYLWWLPDPELGLPAGTFWAWGLGNQALIVIPAWNTVVVHQSDTTAFLKRFLPMLSSDTSADAVIEDLIRSCRRRADRSSEYCVEHRFTTRREFEQLVALIVDARLRQGQ
ncbi:MAG: hypothetical protein AcusKO_23260 [Acuticoccus sp.]